MVMYAQNIIHARYQVTKTGDVTPPLQVIMHQHLIYAPQQFIQTLVVILLVDGHHRFHRSVISFFNKYRHDWLSVLYGLPALIVNDPILHPFFGVQQPFVELWGVYHILSPVQIVLSIVNHREPKVNQSAQSVYATGSDPTPSGDHLPIIYDVIDRTEKHILLVLGIWVLGVILEMQNPIILVIIL